MRNLLKQLDKKGVSIMIGYIILIVIAISLSVLVYAYLQLYLPKDEPKCYDDVSISLDEITCAAGDVSITINNRGLFDVNGVFIRMGEKDRIFKETLNEGQEFILLEPGDEMTFDFRYEPLGIQEVDVEPFVYIDGQPALCSKAVISDTVLCTALDVPAECEDDDDCEGGSDCVDGVCLPDADA